MTPILTERQTGNLYWQYMGWSIYQSGYAGRGYYAYDGCKGWSSRFIRAKILQLIREKIKAKALLKEVQGDGKQ